MDVHFLETDLFFYPSAPNSPLHGETNGEELNWLRLDGNTSHDTEVEVRD